MSKMFTFKRSENFKASLSSLCVVSLFVWSMVFFQYRDTFAAQGTLSWDAPTTNTDGTPLTDLAGFYVCYGTQSRTSSTYPYKKDAFNVATYSLVEHKDVITSPNIYYFSVKAYDTARNESDYSNEVSATFYSLTINKSGSGTVTGLGIDCGSVCTELYIKGKVVTLTATPNSGSSFTGWSGVCSGTGQCVITMNANTTVSATFSSPNTYTIAASAGTGGSISPSGSVIVNQGASQTFTITPTTGYHVANVLVDGSSAGALQSYSFSNVTSNHAIVVTFAIDTPSQEMIIDNRDGTTSSTGTWKASSGDNPYGVDSVFSRDGSTFTWYFTPQQDGNYKVSMWWTYQNSRSTSVPVDIKYSGGTARVFVNQTLNAGTWNIVGTYSFKKGVRYSVTITAQPSPSSTCADAVKLTFSSFIYTITASAGAGGSISPSGSVNINRGGSQTFSITPNPGYHVAEVVVDGSTAGALQSYTFSNVTSNHTIVATFTIDTLSQEITIDNRDAATSWTGTWSISSAVNPYGADSVYSRDGTTFTWYFTPQQDGNYKVSMWWTYRDSRSTSVPVDIKYSGGTARVFVNQTLNAGTWNIVGTYSFKKGVRYSVTITAQPSPASTCADAVRFTPVT